MRLTLLSILVFPFCFMSFLQAQQVNTFLSLLEYVPLDSYEYNAMVQTQDKGYLFCRSAADSIFPPNNHWAEVIRTEVTGEVAWAKRFYKGYTPTVYERSTCSINQLADGSYIFVTSEYDTVKRPQICMFKLDFNGNIIWTKRVSSGSAAIINRVEETDNGGILLAGTSIALNGGQDHAIAIKTDGTGNFLWGIQSKLNADTIAEFVSFAEVPTGYVFTGNCGTSCIMVSTDSIGNVTWNKSLNGVSHIKSLIYTGDSSLLITGQRANTIMIAKFDLSGNLIWGKFQQVPATPPPFSGSFGAGLAESNGNYFFCGYVSNPIPATLLGKVDANGNLLWSKQYWSLYHPFNYTPLTFFKTTDGGFAYSMLSGSTPGIFATAFVKTDANLEAGCGSASYSMLLDTFSINAVSNVITSPAGSTVNKSFTLTPVSVLQEYKCSSIQDSAGVGLKETENNFKLIVFPNPASNILHIKNLPEKSEVRIINITGETLLSVRNLNSIDISSLNDGIYFARIQTSDKENRTIKFIKSK